MITKIRIQNYRSFVDAEVNLRPFSLVVGANGAGKSNFIRVISASSFGHSNSLTKTTDRKAVYVIQNVWTRHVNYIGADAKVVFEFLTNESGDKSSVECIADVQGSLRIPSKEIPWATSGIAPYMIDANNVSGVETVVPNPVVGASGSGTVQVLESLKNGDREDLFDKIEDTFKRYVPEVSKLSLRTADKGKKQIQVREKSLNQLLLASELSEGTRIILCLLTILHQENPPPIILLEDIDRGLHPRLFEYMVPIMRDIAERHGINILATTHNPYLVDCFQDDKEAVIIVEKKDGASTLTTLADRLKDIDYDSVDPEDLPLGSLWFTGHVGGVPAKINRRPEK